MTDYEYTLTVAIKALSELANDNRNLLAEIETLRESKDCPKSNQSKPFYGIRIDSLTNEIESAYHEYIGASISPCNAYKIAQHLSDCADSFVIIHH